MKGIGEVVPLDDMSSRVNSGWMNYSKTPKMRHRTFDGEPYYCELPKHDLYGEYFNPKEFVGWFGNNTISDQSTADKVLVENPCDDCSNENKCSLGKLACKGFNSFITYCTSDRGLIDRDNKTSPTKFWYNKAFNIKESVSDSYLLKFVALLKEEGQQYCTKELGMTVNEVSRLKKLIGGRNEY
jgi:hypothetical protein